MRLRTPIPSEFETLISDLFEYRDEPDGLPRPSHPFSINSLGAAWEVAANARPMPRQSTPLDDHRQRTRYDEGHHDDGPDILLDTQRILSELGLHSGATEAEIADGQRADDIVRYMVEKQKPVRDAKQQRDPEIAIGLRDLGVCCRSHLKLKSAARENESPI